MSAAQDLVMSGVDRYGWGETDEAFGPANFTSREDAVADARATGYVGDVYTARAVPASLSRTFIDEDDLAEAVFVALEDQVGEAADNAKVSDEAKADWLALVGGWIDRHGPGICAGFYQAADVERHDAAQETRP